MLYSEQYDEFSDALPPQVAICLEELRHHLRLEQVRVLQFDNNHVVIPFTLAVSLPTRGAAGGIDIRREEPMLLKIPLSQYPFKMPMVLSDRKDFPAAVLPHLYVKFDDRPSALCLVRGNADEWFANKRVSDVIKVAEEWLHKAAIGRLADDNNEFDTTRLDKFIGTLVYRYEMAREIVQQKIEFARGLGTTVMLGFSSPKTDSDLVFSALTPIPFIALKQTLATLRKVDAKLPENRKTKPIFSLLVWAAGDPVDNHYLARLPNTFGDLKAYLRERGIDLRQVIDSYIRADIHLQNGIPLILAIKRPMKVVGFDGEYEFINFLIDAKGFRTGKYDNNAKVFIGQHVEPFNKTLAAQLSGEQRTESTLYIGGGSLGSKMIMHEAKSGNTDIVVMDHDEFLEHNLSRHALLRDQVGNNKADAIVKELNHLYSFQPDTVFKAYELPLHLGLPVVHENPTRLVDTTASIATLNYLSTEPIPNQVTVCRCEVADDGRLGLLYVEGSNRNPRIDDLVYLSYFRSLSQPAIAAWRKRDLKREVTTLNVGLGCSSTTTVMADDSISFHASIFSKVLQKNKNKYLTKEAGLIYLSICDEKDAMTLSSHTELVTVFDVFNCQAGSGWTVRMVSGIRQRLLELCGKKAPTETGGVLIGIASYKTKTIHVFDIISEPQGSKGTCVGFQRGNIGLPQEVEHYKEVSGGLIGYVGEWHSHPMDLERLSAVDLATIEVLKPLNNRTPIPTCAVIVTRDKLLCHIYE